jgi:hypothetical protein
VQRRSTPEASAVAAGMQSLIVADGAMLGMSATNTSTNISHR